MSDNMDIEIIRTVVIPEKSGCNFDREVMISREDSIEWIDGEEVISTELDFFADMRTDDIRVNRIRFLISSVKGFSLFSIPDPVLIFDEKDSVILTHVFSN